MAHHKSAKKRIRQTVKRTAINRAHTSRVRTFVKKAELALAAGDTEAARTAIKAAEPELMKGVQAGVLHKNTASRKVSRLSARLKALQS